jgi:hypothetical protein
LHNRRELDGIFTALEKANLVVMDCHAASTDLFIDYFTEIDLSAVLSELGAVLTLVMPVNHESDSRLLFPCAKLPPLAWHKRFKTSSRHSPA